MTLAEQAGLAALEFLDGWHDPQCLISTRLQLREAPEARVVAAKRTEWRLHRCRLNANAFRNRIQSAMEVNIGMPCVSNTVQPDGKNSLRGLTIGIKSSKAFLCGQW